jgi:hypothetical protein
VEELKVVGVGLSDDVPFQSVMRDFERIARFRPDLLAIAPGDAIVASGNGEIRLRRVASEELEIDAVEHREPARAILEDVVEVPEVKLPFGVLSEFGDGERRFTPINAIRARSGDIILPKIWTGG